jgi:tetrahydromethanopterin S-methyltransferase subunit G
METMTVDGTEKRIDELSKRMDFGFEQVDHRFEQIDRRFEQVEGQIVELRADTKAGFESLNRTIIYLLGGALSVICSGVLALVLHAIFLSA